MPLILLSTVSPCFLIDASEDQYACFTGDVSAGYVFKRDSLFKEVYGLGTVNVITADGCYYPWRYWGIGTKVGYWQANGHTTILKQSSLSQEVPVTFYVRARKNFTCRLQGYASVGVGFIWMREESYLGSVRQLKGIGEAEIGLRCNLWRCLDFTRGFRYLFPRQLTHGIQADVGGLDLRGGIGCSF